MDWWTLFVIAAVLSPVIAWPLIRSARNGGSLSKWPNKKE